MYRIFTGAEAEARFGSIERPGKTQAKGVQHTNAAYFYKQAAP